MTLLRRVAPALALLLIAPLIAEYLLGDFNVRQFGLLAVFVPVYGAGALLVREIARRTGRGWPTMLLLALAYALLLEGAVNQTLFNPNYAGQHLLQYGFVPTLGVSFNWTVFVLTLHVVWSLGSSIALAEGLAGTRWREPWLRLPGFVIVAVLLLLGCVATAVFTLRTFHFVASVAQFIGVAVVIAAVIALAFAAFRGTGDRGVSSGAGAPPLALVFAVSLILSSAFQLWFGFAPRHALPAAVGLAGMLGLEAIAVALFAAWSRRPGWAPAGAVAASAGAVLTYGWISLRRLVVAGGTSLGVPATPIDVIGQALLLLALLGLGVVAWWRIRGAATESARIADSGREMI